MSEANLFEHYRQRGTAEALLGALADVPTPAVSSARRSNRHDRGRRRPALATCSDALTRNEALLLQHLLICDVLHTGRRLMEAVTGSGSSLRCFRERFLRDGGCIVLHARRVTMIVAETAPDIGISFGDASIALSTFPAPSHTHHRR